MKILEKVPVPTWGKFSCQSSESYGIKYAKSEADK